MVDTELLVVGAGPAGAAAAITAADLGLDAIVCDRAVFPRDKTCGDGLTSGALRLLEELGVTPGAMTTYGPVREVLLVAPGGRRVILPMPEDGHHAGVVPRAELDDALVRVARARGADVREGAALEDLVHDTDGVRATLADGTEIRARWVIAADGHFSRARKLCGAAGLTDTVPHLGESHAWRQYWTGVDQERLTVLFDGDLLPGYAWVFPIGGGRANVGFGVLRTEATTGKSLAALSRDVFTRSTLRSVLGPDACPEDARRAWPVPMHLVGSELSAGRVLFAGDAAGAVDPLTGEGVAQALESGRLAARAVAAGGPPDAVTRRYRQTVGRVLARDLRFAAFMKWLLRTPDRTNLALAAADLNGWTRRSFARWMFEDYPRAVLLTPDRWRRGVFTPPGAFGGPIGSPRSAVSAR